MARSASGNGVGDARTAAAFAGALRWDNHGCMPMRADPAFLPQLARYRDAGIDLVSLNVGYGTMPWERHLELLMFMRGWIAARPHDYQLVTSLEDITLARAANRLGVMFDVEGMTPVAEDPARVALLYELGVRWMLIAYNRSNAAGGGCLDTDPGLTSTGRAIIDAMAACGMVLCLSHTGARTAAQALDYSDRPVIFSHSNPHGDTAHPRNVGDALLKRCAEGGGVIGLSGIGPFLGAPSETDLVPRFLAQLRYLVDLVGPAHIGLGLDYVFDRSNLDRNVRNNPRLFPPETQISGAMPMVAPEDVPAIVDGLARSSLSDADIRGILGANWLRIAQQCWR